PPDRVTQHLHYFPTRRSSDLITSRVLRRAGYEVKEVGTGEDALREVKKRPDLVILDVNLPDISGLELSQILRGNRATQHLPILQDRKSTRLNSSHGSISYAVF